MGSDDLRKDAEQLQLLVRRVEVEQRDDEDDRRTRPPTILREQQRSPYTTCGEVGGRTWLRLRKTHVGSAATRNRPKTARRAPKMGAYVVAVAWKLVRAPRRTPSSPSPAALRRHRGGAMLPAGAIATSLAL